MMFLSCLFTYPIYSPPLNEILEETMKNKKSMGIFVSDSKRLTCRILQTVMISFIAYICPFFGDIISLDILFVFCVASLHRTRRIRLYSNLLCDSPIPPFHLLQR